MREMADRVQIRPTSDSRAKRRGLGRMAWDGRRGMATPHGLCERDAAGEFASTGRRRPAPGSIDTPPLVHYRPATQMTTYFWYRSPA